MHVDAVDSGRLLAGLPDETHTHPGRQSIGVGLDKYNDVYVVVTRTGTCNCMSREQCMYNVHDIHMGRMCIVYYRKCVHSGLHRGNLTMTPK